MAVDKFIIFVMEGDKTAVAVKGTSPGKMKNHLVEGKQLGPRIFCTADKTKEEVAGKVGELIIENSSIFKKWFSI